MSLRDLPSVDRLTGRLDPSLPRDLAVDIARAAIDEARSRLQQGDEVDAEQLAIEASARLLDQRPRPVINATGVLLHTNLGRAPLHPAAAAAAQDTGRSYASIEFDVGTGERGHRGDYLHRLLTSMTGAEAALVVNNNAGALLLALVALAKDRKVPVSRGELIEIGGSYRLPDLIEASGAEMVEVGTTNRTRIADYERVIDQATGLILKVHPSNYRLVGFTESTTIPELAALAASAHLPLVFDAGSGLLDSRTPWLPGPTPGWLAAEPGVVQSLQAGADLVLFSGDKLFGGPQAGIAVGRRDLIERMRRHPFARALRIDGPTLAALIATTRLYGDGAGAEIPFWQMATMGTLPLEERCRQVMTGADVGAKLISTAAPVGGGTVPGLEIAGPAIAIEGHSEQWFVQLLAATPMPIVARRDAGTLVLDLRSVMPEHDELVAAALARVCR